MVARSVNRARYGKADAVKRYIDGNDTPGKYQRHDATRHSSILRGKPCIPWFYAGQPHRITIRLSGTYSLYMEPYHNCLSNVLFCRDSSPRRPIAEYRHCRCRSIKFRDTNRCHGVRSVTGTSFSTQPCFDKKRDRAARSIMRNEKYPETGRVTGHLAKLATCLPRK